MNTPEIPLKGFRQGNFIIKICRNIISFYLTEHMVNWFKVFPYLQRCGGCRCNCLYPWEWSCAKNPMYQEPMYVNRTGYHSINMQLVRFVYIFNTPKNNSCNINGVLPIHQTNNMLHKLENIKSMCLVILGLLMIHLSGTTARWITCYNICI